MITSLSDYVYVTGDILSVLIDGNIMPYRDDELSAGLQSKYCLRGEDICYLMERQKEIEQRYSGMQILNGGIVPSPDDWSYGWQTTSANVIPTVNFTRAVSNTQLSGIIQGYRGLYGEEQEYQLTNNMWMKMVPVYYSQVSAWNNYPEYESSYEGSYCGVYYIDDLSKLSETWFTQEDHPLFPAQYLDVLPTPQLSSVPSEISALHIQKVNTIFGDADANYHHPIYIQTCLPLEPYFYDPSELPGARQVKFWELSYGERHNDQTSQPYGTYFGYQATCEKVENPSLTPTYKGHIFWLEQDIFDEWVRIPISCCTDSDGTVTPPEVWCVAVFDFYYVQNDSVVQSYTAPALLPMEYYSEWNGYLLYYKVPRPSAITTPIHSWKSVIEYAAIRFADDAGFDLVKTWEQLCNSDGEPYSEGQCSVWIDSIIVNNNLPLRTDRNSSE